MKHFQDLSLLDKLQVYKNATKCDGLHISEKVDGVFLGLRFEVTVDKFGVPKFPPFLSFKSYNSPWCKTPADYLDWAKPGRFSEYFAKVIKDLSENQEFVDSVIGKMIETKTEILEAELLSADVAEYDPKALTLKMIRTKYPLSKFQDWEAYAGHYLIFHSQQNTSRTLFYCRIPEIDRLIGKDPIEEVVSTKAENRERRTNLTNLLNLEFTKPFLDIIISKGIEGLILRTDQGIISKIVHPDFMSWPLNPILFDGDVNG